MIKSFETIIERARRVGPKTLVAAVAQEVSVLKAVYSAYNYGIVNGILVGDREEICKISEENNVDISKFNIVDVKDKAEACKRAVEIIKGGKASLLMKGFVDTSIILKAVLHREFGLKKEGILSHVGVLEVRGYDRLFILSDAAMNISPKLKEKVGIIKNAVKVAHGLGNPEPKVAVLCAVEKINPKMPATLEARELEELNKKGEINGCIVGGPLALDNAISIEAAKRKGIDHPVAGRADILITPNIEAGNILNKAMEYFAQANKAGIIMGSQVPIVLTSRASSEVSKLNSIALGAVISHNS